MSAKTQNLLVAGFRQSEIEAFSESGATVQAAFVVMDHRKPLPDLPVELYKHHDVVRCYCEVAFRSDFPSELRLSLYNSSIQLFRRHFTRITYLKDRSLRSWLDMDNMYHIAANFFFDLIKRNNITAVAFSNFPHEGSYIVLYHLARLMGLQTIIVTQSQFPGKLWVVTKISEFGHFNSISDRSEALAAPKAPTSPFYMKRRSRNWRRAATAGIVLRESMKLAAKVLTTKAIWDKDSVERNMGRLVQAKDRLKLGAPSTKDIANVDLNVDFVYFPLHLQPEMTTDTWGLAYADQLLALEELSAALPEGIMIYAKENPIQTRFMREESFYRRLRAIKNLRYVGELVPTFDLIRQSRFVATISGTAGWEATLMGKAAIHFGVAWYASIPGAFRWNGPETIAKVMDFKADRAALEHAFAALTRKLYPGVVDPHYGVLIPNFDREAEGRKAVQSILSVLRETSVTPAHPE